MPLPQAIQRSDLSRLREEYPYVYLPCLGRDTCLENWGTARGRFFALKHSTGNPVWTDRFGFPAIQMTSGSNTGMNWGGTVATLGNTFAGAWNGLEVSALIYIRPTPGTRRILSFTCGSGTYALGRSASTTTLNWGGTGTIGSVTSASTFNDTFVHVIAGWDADRTSGGSASAITYFIVANLLTGELLRDTRGPATYTAGPPQTLTIGEVVAGSTNAENVDVLAYTLSTRGRDLAAATKDAFNPWKFLRPKKVQSSVKAAAGGGRLVGRPCSIGSSMLVGLPCSIG